MKILAMHNEYQHHTGEDLAFDAMVQGLRERGHAVTELKASNASLASLGARLALAFGIVFSLRWFFRTVAAIRATRPDVAIIQNVFPLLSPSVYWACRLMGVPVAHRLFNYRPICPNGILYTREAICERCARGAFWNAVRFRCYRESRLYSAAMALAVASARATGAWSRATRLILVPDRFLGAKMGEAMPGVIPRLRTVFNPAPLDSLGRTPVFEGRSRTVLFVGRWVRAKGIFTIVEIARRLPDVTFEIVGFGPDGDAARALAGTPAPANLVWLGPVYGEDLYRLYESAGVLVVPSEWYDNMPLVLTQGMLAGIPVVASDIDGIPEFVVEGETGRLAAPGDADGFARRVKEALDAPERTLAMARTAAARAQAAFLPHAHFDALEAALREIATTSD